MNDGDASYGVRPLMVHALSQAVSAGGITRKPAAGEEVTNSQVDCVASLLKAFVRELSSPVFPRDAYFEVLGAFSGEGGVGWRARARARRHCAGVPRSMFPVRVLLVVVLRPGPP